MTSYTTYNVHTRSRPVQHHVLCCSNVILTQQPPAYLEEEKSRASRSSQMSFSRQSWKVQAVAMQVLSLATQLPPLSSSNAPSQKRSPLVSDNLRNLKRIQSSEGRHISDGANVCARHTELLNLGWVIVQRQSRIRSSTVWSSQSEAGRLPSHPWTGVLI